MKASKGNRCGRISILLALLVPGVDCDSDGFNMFPPKPIKKG